MKSRRKEKISEKKLKNVNTKNNKILLPNIFVTAPVYHPEMSALNSKAP